jgi:hypothetical protein
VNKQNTLVSGAVILALGIIMAIHGNIRSSSLEGALTSLVGGMPPGGGEMLLGVLVGLVGVVFLIVGAIKKDK